VAEFWNPTGVVTLLGRSQVVVAALLLRAPNRALFAVVMSNR